MFFCGFYVKKNETVNMKDRCHVFVIQKNCNPIFTKSLPFVEKYLRYEKSFPYKENVVPAHVRQSVYKSLSLHQFLRCNKMQFHQSGISKNMKSAEIGSFGTFT